MAFSPVRLNHAVLFVSDLQTAVRFYTNTFGMDVIAQEPRADAAFLRLPRSGNHHDLGLFAIGTAGAADRPLQFADLRGAKFCHTIMPDGHLNNADC